MVAVQERRIGTEALASTLEEKLSDWNQIVILGIGNEFSGDDALGFQIARRLRRALPNTAGVEILTVGTAPENFTGLLRRLSPSHVVLIDAAEMGEMAGTIELIEPRRIEKRMPTTHTMPLYLLTEYIEQELLARVLVLGIQPGSLSFGSTVSREVEGSIDKLARVLAEVISRKEEMLSRTEEQAP
jgi:hydrogenase 3 maturation protease